MRVLDQSRVRYLFDYDERSGQLVRRISKANQVAGSVVGSVNARGHLNVSVDGAMWSVHQVVFVWHHGWLPVEIDHENRIKTDNRIENLRPATSTQNKGNIGLLGSNRSGFRGVSLNRRSMKWHAQIKVLGKQTYLGRFDTPEEAAVTYNHAARLYFGEFAHLNDV